MASPILCAHVIRKVDVMLLELLASLRPDEWELQTVAPQWQVRDVAAHLLDTALRKLSLVRDGYATERPAADLAAFVNRLNREGVTVYRRLSPPVLISLMAAACRESADFHESLNPFAPAALAVSWAGKDHSPNWFDTARELTERWHHQQQIRHATGRAGLMIPELYHPVLDCFLRGLPHAYRAVEATTGATVQAKISGDCGGLWQILKQPSGWALSAPGPACDTRITIPQALAWRLFTKGISVEEAEAQVQIEGNRELALPLLRMTAIVG